MIIGGTELTTRGRSDLVGRPLQAQNAPAMNQFETLILDTTKQFAIPTQDTMSPFTTPTQNLASTAPGQINSSSPLGPVSQS